MKYYISGMPERMEFIGVFFFFTFCVDKLKRITVYGAPWYSLIYFAVKLKLLSKMKSIFKKINRINRKGDRFGTWPWFVDP